MEARNSINEVYHLKLKILLTHLQVIDVLNPVEFTSKSQNVSDLIKIGHIIKMYITIKTHLFQKSSTSAGISHRKNDTFVLLCQIIDGCNFGFGFYSESLISFS